MNRASVAAFAARATAEIRNVFAVPEVPVIWKGQRYCVACTGIRESHTIEPGGFEVDPAATLRIPMATYPAFTPALGDLIQVGKTIVKVTGKTTIALSGEIKLELGKA